MIPENSKLINPTKNPQNTIIIPVRYNSNRFPGKALAQINNKPMIEHVINQCKQSKLANRILVATDWDHVHTIAKQCGVESVIVNDVCTSGTDRVAKAYFEYFQYDENDIIINVQGDNPFIEPDLIDGLFRFQKNNNYSMNTAANECNSWMLFNDMNCVKVLVDVLKKALYFTRLPLPLSGYKSFLRHCGIYSYNPKMLNWFLNTKPSEYELSENLEQMRPLQNGIAIGVMVSEYEIGTDINSPADLREVNRK